MDTICNICCGRTSKIFDAVVLKKFVVNYYKCDSCLFIQTETPHWLPESYISAITVLDVGLVHRNIQYSKIIPAILDTFSNPKDSYLDYGGGYGMFVRIMRDLGYDYYLQDKYAENVYAKYFEVTDYKGSKKFTAISAFEVFEHLEDPIKEIDEMFKFSDTIIFSTLLHPNNSFKSAADWHYFLPEIGQHISFFSKDSLIYLSKKYKCNLYSNGSDLHILTKLNFNIDPLVPRENKKKNVLFRIINRLHRQLNLETNNVERISYLMSDFEMYKRKLESSE